MLEIKLVRENLDLVKTAMQNRGTAIAIGRPFRRMTPGGKPSFSNWKTFDASATRVSDQVAGMKRSGENADAIIEKMRDVSTDHQTSGKRSGAE
jgi:seryl-tRNA synthetase